MMHPSLDALTTPVVTPMNVDGRIDSSMFQQHMCRLVDHGLTSLMLLGTTGEFASLSSEEREKLLAVADEVLDSNVQVIAGGCPPSLTGAIEWLEVLVSYNIDIAVITAPYFHNSNSPDGISQYFEDIAAKARVPILLYNIPQCVGESIPEEVVTKLARQFQFIGLKDSGGDLTYSSSLLNETPDDFYILQGVDGLLIPSLRSGFDGAVSALSNAFPRLIKSAVGSPHRPEASELHQDVMLPLQKMCLSDGFAPTTKAAMMSRGWLISDAVRPPLVTSNSHHVQAITDRAVALI